MNKKNNQNYLLIIIHIFTLLYFTLLFLVVRGERWFYSKYIDSL